MNRNPQQPAVNPPRAKSRRGVAFLILVVMVAIVVLGATHSLVRIEIQTRRGTQDWIRSQVMRAAVERTQQRPISGNVPWSLPIDGDDEFLEVRKNDDSGEVIVRWIRRGAVIDEMIRNVAPTPTDSEEIE